MDRSITHRDPAGFRARNVRASEFREIATLLVARSHASGEPDAVVRLASALSIASDGIWGTQVFWLIEHETMGKIALAHSSPAGTGGPDFDGLVWLGSGLTSASAPLSIRPEAICSIVAFCDRFLGYPFSPDARTTATSHR